MAISAQKELKLLATSIDIYVIKLNSLLLIRI